MSTPARLIWQVLPYGVAAALLAAVVRQAEWRTLAADSHTILWAVIALAVLSRLGSLVVSALRWRVLLEPSRHLPLGGVVAVTMMGAAATAVAPLQAAELVRPYLLSRRYGVDLAATLATTMTEWVLDGLAVAVVCLPALAWHGAGHSGSGQTGLLTGSLILFVLAAAGLLLLRRLPASASRVSASTRWIAALPASLRDRVVPGVRSFGSGLRALEQPAGLSAVAAYSVGFAVLTALSAWLTLRAFHLPLSLPAGFLLLGFVTVAGIIPTPGAVGGFHAVCQLGLVTLLGIDPVHAVLPVLVLHGVLYLPAAALGALCFLIPSAQPLPGDA